MPTEEAPAGPRGGYVYVLRHPTAGLFKIGRSAGVARRADDVSKAAGGLCEVVHLIATDDPARLEAELHRTHAAVRSAGEWFRLGADALAALRATERVTYGTLAAPRRVRRGVYRISLPAAVAERLERTAATLGITGDALARKVVCLCLSVFERRAGKAEAKRAADAAWDGIRRDN
jgi:hypothetical protein